MCAIRSSPPSERKVRAARLSVLALCSAAACAAPADPGPDAWVLERRALVANVANLEAEVRKLKAALADATLTVPELRAAHRNDIAALEAQLQTERKRARAAQNSEYDVRTQLTEAWTLLGPFYRDPDQKRACVEAWIAENRQGDAECAGIWLLLDED